MLEADSTFIKNPIQLENDVQSKGHLLAKRLRPCSVDFLDGGVTNVAIFGPMEEKKFIFFIPTNLQIPKLFMDSSSLFYPFMLFFCAPSYGVSPSQTPKVGSA